MFTYSGNDFSECWFLFPSSEGRADGREKIMEVEKNHIHNFIIMECVFDGSELMCNGLEGIDELNDVFRRVM